MNPLIQMNDINEMSVHLWCVPLEPFSADLPAHPQFLSPEEKERAARFRFERDRKRYERAHGALRVILGSYLRKKPQSIRFRISGNGKPELFAVPGGPLITFNMSHSGDLMLLGVAKNRRIGVDVEKISSGIDIFEIAERYFTDTEAEEIRETPAEKQLESFFSRWTCKEAYLKAVGSGLAGGLQSFTVSKKDHFRTISWKSDAGEQQLDSWTIQSMELMDGYAAAVAIEGTGLDITGAGTYSKRRRACCTEGPHIRSGPTVCGSAG